MSRSSARRGAIAATAVFFGLAVWNVARVSDAGPGDFSPALGALAGVGFLLGFVASITLFARR